MSGTELNVWVRAGMIVVIVAMVVVIVLYHVWVDRRRKHSAQPDKILDRNGDRRSAQKAAR